MTDSYDQERNVTTRSCDAPDCTSTHVFNIGGYTDPPEYHGWWSIYKPRPAADSLVACSPEHLVVIATLAAYREVLLAALVKELG